MNTFVVSKRGDGRVILDHVSHGQELQRITAKHYADARLMVSVPVYDNPGYGVYSLLDDEA